MRDTTWTRRHVVWSLATVAVVVVVLWAVVPRVWAMFDEITDSCEWSEADHRRLDAVDLEAFLGQEVPIVSAFCGVSPPYDLSRTAQVDGAQSLPEGWQDREVVVGWTLAGTVDANSRTVLCYTSTDERWRDVEVTLWSDGLVEARIQHDGAPCDGFTTG